MLMMSLGATCSVDIRASSALLGTLLIKLTDLTPSRSKEALQPQCQPQVCTHALVYSSHKKTFRYMIRHWVFFSLKTELFWPSLLGRTV